jgi:outer membrane lipoprotein-sorting protein
MGNHLRTIFLVTALSICFLLIVSPGCLTGAPADANLTAAELADQFLANAGTIRDYRSEYTSISGNAENRYLTRIRYDYKLPSFARLEVVGSDSRGLGTLLTANGTMTAEYDADTRTYRIANVLEYVQQYDNQAIFRRIITDRNFTIIGRDMSHGPVRYLIKVVTGPSQAHNYGPYINSDIRAWVEPSTGLTWAVTTYPNCGSTPVPTLPPGIAVITVACGQTGRPDKEIQYESIAVNTGIPDSYFDFIPPEGSAPEVVQYY